MIDERLLEPAFRPGDLAEAVPRTPTTQPGANPDATFPQSVASSGPTPSGVILWTRLDPDLASNDTPLYVELGPEHGDEFVRSWRIDPERIGEHHDHTVRIDLNGHLDPDTRYRYRFVHDETASRTGHCQTLPEPTDSPDSLRVGVLSCQDYQNGRYGALHHVAEEDLDFVLHLGDFIYNSAAGQFTAPFSNRFPDRDVTLPSGHDRAWTLADLRTIYRAYLSTRPLQRVRENHTLVRTWDDHAVANNRYWDYDLDAPQAPDHPLGDDPAFMRDLTAAGIKSFWEYTPARIDYDPSAEHLHDRFHLWRGLQYGDLATLLLTDERLFRSPAPCDDSLLPPWAPFCSGTNDPARTMLGDTQCDWFTSALAESPSTWTVWGNEVLSMPLRVGIGSYGVYPNVDSWDGYAAERREIMDSMAQNDDTSFVTLTGDMHTLLAGYQRRRVPGIRAGSPDAPNERVGVEFMTPAATSVNVAEVLALDRLPFTTHLESALSRAATTMNPHLAAFDSYHWGYSVAEFSREDCTFTTYAVDKGAAPAKAPKRVLRRFRTPAGSDDVSIVDS